MTKLEEIIQFGFSKIDAAVGHSIWMRTTPKELGFIDCEAMIFGPRPYDNEMLNAPWPVNAPSRG